MAGTKKRREPLSLEQLQARKARLEQQERELDERIKAKKQMLSKQERTAETHAKIVIGGMYLSAIGVDWKQVDFSKVSAYIRKWTNQLVKQTGEELPLKDAKKRLSDWERDRSMDWDNWLPGQKQTPMAGPAGPGGE